MLLKLTAGLYAKYRMLLPFRRHKLVSFTLKKKNCRNFVIDIVIKQSVFW